MCDHTIFQMLLIYHFTHHILLSPSNIVLYVGLYCVFLFDNKPLPAVYMCCVCICGLSLELFYSD